MAKHVTEYAGTLKGAAIMALDRWRFYRNTYDRKFPLGSSAGFSHTQGIYEGQMKAYSQVLFLITGFRVESEEAKVQESVEAIRP